MKNPIHITVQFDPRYNASALLSEIEALAENKEGVPVVTKSNAPEVFCLSHPSPMKLLEDTARFIFNKPSKYGDLDHILIQPDGEVYIATVVYATDWHRE